MRLFTILLGCMIAFPAHAAFSDTANSPYRESIDYMQKEGIVEGYSDGTYRPNQRINRAEFTKIITVVDNGGLPTQGAGPCFSDISGTEWYASVVCWAKGYGAISGYPDGTFRPSNNINFVEAAKIVSKIFDPHAVQGDSEPWYQIYIDYLNGKRAIPYPHPNPDDFLTRGQLAYIIHTLKTGEESSSNTVTLLSSPQYKDYEDGVIGNGIGSVLFFHAAWCPYCIKNDQRLTGWFADPGPSFPVYSVYKVDYDDSKDLRSQFGVTTQDTFILIDRDGNEERKLTFPNESSLYELLEMPPMTN